MQSETISDEIGSTHKTDAIVSDNENIKSARQWIENAFNLNVQNIIPEIEYNSESSENLVFYLDEQQPMMRIMVQMDSDSDYPEYIYYFHHANLQNVDISKDDSFEFDEDSVRIARDFLTKLYSIDEEPSTIRVYGYQNKVAIQFLYANGHCFDIRMYYEDYEPVGCFHISPGEDCDAWIDLHNAKIFYEQ